MRKYINNLRERWREWEDEDVVINLIFYEIITNNRMIQYILLSLIRVSVALILISYLKTMLKY